MPNHKVGGGIACTIRNISTTRVLDALISIAGSSSLMHILYMYIRVCVYGRPVRFRRILSCMKNRACTIITCDAFGSRDVRHGALLTEAGMKMLNAMSRLCNRGHGICARTHIDESTHILQQDSTCKSKKQMDHEELALTFPLGYIYIYIVYMYGWMCRKNARRQKYIAFDIVRK